MERANPLVLLDANALFLPGRAGFPLDDEVHRHGPGAVVAVPSSVVRELDRLVERGAPGAGPARALANRYPVLPARGQGDDAVLELARRRRAWVVTSDRALRERLRATGLAVLFPRDRHRLELFRGEPPARSSVPSPGPRTTRRSERARGNG